MIGKITPRDGLFYRLLALMHEIDHNGLADLARPSIRMPYCRHASIWIGLEIGKRDIAAY
jgi:hypothetical protein